jgi:hypothetical protein
VVEEMGLWEVERLCRMRVVRLLWWRRGREWWSWERFCLECCERE